ncbi:MAG: AraC family transcriptional regulator, partial [Actinomycetota bacterium]|nr:AraC family transcriptional regulator [Actinomycetota bacterium]
MSAPARYVEHRPPPSLAALVECGWTLTCEGGLPEHRVLPDGCIDLVVVGGRDPTVAGPATRAFLSPLRAGQFAAGIRFRPGAGAVIVGVAAGELRDRHVALADLWT